MATTPARNGTLGETVASLAAQTCQPDEIRVYITSGCVIFPIPVGVHLRFLPFRDHGPITKLAAVSDSSLSDDAIIVTVDDDTTYAPRFLETLLREFAGYSVPVAVGLAGWNRKRNMTQRAGTPDRLYMAGPGLCDVLSGWAGVAYRKGWFKPDVLEPPEAFRLVDDVWIAHYLAKRRVQRTTTSSPMTLPRKQPVLPGLHDRPDFLELNRTAVRLAWPR